MKCIICGAGLLECVGLTVQYGGPQVCGPCLDKRATGGDRVTIAQFLKQYFHLQSKLYEYFGYEEDWRVIPLADHTGDHWVLHEEANGSGWLFYCHGQLTETLVRDGEFIFGATIYTQRHLPKWVYRAADYTMVVADTHCDGNKFLMVFDNSKECKDPALKKIYQELWANL